MGLFKKVLGVGMSSLILISATSCANDDSGKPTEENDQLSIWGTYSIAKVIKNPEYNYNNAILEAALDVAAGRGEGESGQIIVTTRDKGVREYTVETSDLKNENGDVYSAENVDVFNQFYTLVKTQTWKDESGISAYFPAQEEDGPATSGWIPDALVPQKYSVQAKENFIDPNSNQGITFDFNVPIDTPAGIYTGKFQLKLDGKSHDIPVKLQVWDYDISEVNGSNLWDIGRWGFMSSGEMTADCDGLYYTYYDFLMEYKLNGFSFIRWHEDGVHHFIEKLREYVDKPAFGSAMLPDFGGNRSEMTPYFAEIAKASIEDGVNYFKSLRFYHQSVDEPQQSGTLDQAVQIVEDTNTILKDIATALQNGRLEDENGKAVSGFDKLSPELQQETLDSIVNMPQMVTTYYEATDEMQGLVNEFCPQPQRYETDLQRRMYDYNTEQTNGVKSVYTCVNPIHPYPSTHVDDFMHGARALGWMRKDYGIPDYLNWQANVHWGMSGEGLIYQYYAHAIDPYTDPVRFNGGGGWISNGDGYIMFPMAKYKADKPIPSNRLLNQRDSQEDYDTLCKAEKTYESLSEYYGLETADVDANLQKALSAYYDRLYYNVIAYTDDANFERVRRALGGLTEASNDASKTLILQNDNREKTATTLRIYSEANELFVNGQKLTKSGKYFSYTQKLSQNDNSVLVKYVKDGTTKSFEYLLSDRYEKATVKGELQAPVRGASTIVQEGESIRLKAVSYIDAQPAVTMGTKLNFTIPFDVDYKRLDNLSMTLKNTCGERLTFKLYFKFADGTVEETPFDEAVVFPYEEYSYERVGLHERLKSYEDVVAIVVRFENYMVDVDLKMIAYPDRTMEIKDVTYTLKG